MFLDFPFVFAREHQNGLGLLGIDNHAVAFEDLQDPPQLSDACSNPVTS